MAMKLTSKQRAYLRSLAQNVEATFQIGKEGVTPELTAAIDETLCRNELIKLTALRTVEEDLREVGDTLAGRTKSTLVEVIGRKIVLYRKDPDNPKIILPRQKQSREED